MVTLGYAQAMNYMARKRQEQEQKAKEQEMERERVREGLREEGREERDAAWIAHLASQGIEVSPPPNPNGNQSS